VSTAVFYSLCTLCQYFTHYHLLVLGHCVHCYLLHSVNSVSFLQFTVSSFHVTMSSAVFHNLSTFCQYLSLYNLLVPCHYVHCCLINSVHCMSVPHTVQVLDSVSVCTLLSSKLSPLSVSTSHYTVYCPCDTFSISILYSLATACLYLTLYGLLVLFLYVFCSHLQSVHSLSALHILPSVCSVSLCSLLYSTVCSLSVRNLHYSFFFILCLCVHCCLLQCVQCLRYLTLYRLLVLCLSVYCFLLKSFQCLSIPHIVPSLILRHCFHCCLPNSLHCLSVLLFVLCPYVHCCFLQSVHSLSVPHTVPSVGSVSVCPLLSSTVCPLSVSTSQCAVSCFCVRMSTAVFYSLSSPCLYLTLLLLTVARLMIALLL